MTFLQLINRVLVRLREKTVATPTENEYSTLIGAYINDAKEVVEKAWNWKSLRREITFNTVSSQNDYNLGAGGVATGGTTNEHSRLLMDNLGRPCLWNTTEEVRMSMQDLEVLRDWDITSPDDATPSTFALIRASTGMTVRFVPAPDAVYAMKGVFIIPQDELSAGSDVLTVASSPVWKIALARASGERGAGMGEDSEGLLANAQLALRDAIVEDGEESDFTMVPM